MWNCDNSLHYSWNGYDFLYNPLYDFHSRNLYYLFDYFVSENLNNFGDNFFNVNWNRLLYLDRNMLNISDNHRLFNNKFNWSEMFNKERNLSINNYQLFLNCFEGNNFLNKDWFLSDDLFVNWHLSVACNLYYFLFYIWLDEMTFLNNNFFRNLFVNWLFNFYDNCLWFLTVTMFRIVYRFLNQNFCNFGNF